MAGPAVLQFVNFTAVTERTMNMTPERREAAFALNALMEVPEQYVAMGNLSLIGRRGPDLRPRRWQTMPLPPPPGATALGPDGGRPSAPPPPIFAAQNAKLAEPQTGPVDPIWFECPISKEVCDSLCCLGWGGA